MCTLFLFDQYQNLPSSQFNDKKLNLKWDTAESGKLKASFKPLLASAWMAPTVFIVRLLCNWPCYFANIPSNLEYQFDTEETWLFKPSSFLKFSILQTGPEKSLSIELRKSLIWKQIDQSMSSVNRFTGWSSMSSRYWWCWWWPICVFVDRDVACQ